jgi:hypothetical protein
LAEGVARLYDYSDFEVTMAGPEGPYAMIFRSTHDGDGEVDVTIAGVDMTWWVTRIERDEDGRVCFSGMTAGSEQVWGDQFLFLLRVGSGGPTIEYWIDKVIWRADAAAN